MQFTPSQAAEHLKESIASYTESQYRISHPLVFAERSALLRERGVIAQDPFIEATPAFAPARFLRELEEEYPASASRSASGRYTYRRMERTPGTGAVLSPDADFPRL